MKVNHYIDYIHLSQNKYIRDLLDSSNLIESKPFSTPMTSGSILDKFDGFVLTNAMCYRKLVGSLQ